MLITFKKQLGGGRIYVSYSTDEAQRGIIWRKIGVWRLKGVRRNNDQGDLFHVQQRGN
jgi:hypothetical protein